MMTIATSFDYHVSCFSSLKSESILELFSDLSSRFGISPHNLSDGLKILKGGPLYPVMERHMVMLSGRQRAFQQSFR